MAQTIKRTIPPPPGGLVGHLSSYRSRRVCLNVAGRDSRVEVAGAGAGAGKGRG